MLTQKKSPPTVVYVNAAETHKFVARTGSFRCGQQRAERHEVGALPIVRFETLEGQIISELDAHQFREERGVLDREPSGSPDVSVNLRPCASSRSIRVLWPANPATGEG